MISGKIIKDDDTNFCEMIKTQYKEAYSCAEKIKKEPVLIKQLKGIENGRKITKISS